MTEQWRLDDGARYLRELADKLEAGKLKGIKMRTEWPMVEWPVGDDETERKYKYTGETVVTMSFWEVEDGRLERG